MVSDTWLDVAASFAASITDRVVGNTGSAQSQAAGAPFSPQQIAILQQALGACFNTFADNVNARFMQIEGKLVIGSQRDDVQNATRDVSSCGQGEVFTAMREATSPSATARKNLLRKQHRKKGKEKYRVQRHAMLQMRHLSEVSDAVHSRAANSDQKQSAADKSLSMPTVVPSEAMNENDIDGIDALACGAPGYLTTSKHSLNVRMNGDNDVASCLHSRVTSLEAAFAQWWFQQLVSGHSNSDNAHAADFPEALVLSAVPASELTLQCNAVRRIQRSWRRRLSNTQSEASRMDGCDHSDASQETADADFPDAMQVSTNWLGFECGFCLAPITVELLPMFRICQDCVWDSLFEGVESGDETAPTDNSEAMDNSHHNATHRLRCDSSPTVCAEEFHRWRWDFFDEEDLDRLRAVCSRHYRLL